MCTFILQAMLKVKRLKEARDYSFLMSDAPDELPMKKPSTPLKPGRSPGMVMCNCNLCLAETVQVVLGYLLLRVALLEICLFCYGNPSINSPELVTWEH